MKKIAVLTAAAMLFMCGAQAVTMDAYTQAIGMDAEWKEMAPSFLYTTEAGEGMSVSLCIRENEIAALTIELSGDAQAENAAEWLKAFGVADPEVMFSLGEEYGEASAEADGLMLIRVNGRERTAFSVCDMADYGSLVWISVHGGECWHRSPICSDLDVGCFGTEEAGLAYGKRPCGIEFKSAYEGEAETADAQ